MIAIPMRVSVTDVRIPVGVEETLCISASVATNAVDIPVAVGVSVAGLPVSVGASAVGIPAAVATEYAMREGEIYDGGYVFTPSDAVQTVKTKNKTLIDNITINPIPNNWGRITYNGAIITVS